MIGRNVLVENFSFDVYFRLPYPIPLEATHILMRRNDVRSRHSSCSFLVGHHTTYLRHLAYPLERRPCSVVDLQTINSRNLHRGAWVVPRETRMIMIGLSPTSCLPRCTNMSWLQELGMLHMEAEVFSTSQPPSRPPLSHYHGVIFCGPPMKFEVVVRGVIDV